MYVRTASRLLFAATFIGIGMVGLVGGTFAPIWAGVPKALPDRQLLAYLCAIVSLACGGGLLVRRTTPTAAFVLFIYLLLWTALFKFPLIIQHPLVEVWYQTNGENAVLIAGALALFAATDTSRSPSLLHFLRGSTGLRIAYVLYGLALIAFGFSHFAYLDLTAPLVPTWLTAPVFWAYLTGSIYLLCGLAMVSGFGARLGAAIAALQIAIITLLVWGPMVVRGQMSADHWQETVVSWTLTVAAIVIAISFEGRRWIIRRDAPTPVLES